MSLFDTIRQKFFGGASPLKPPKYFRGAGGTMPPGALAANPHARLDLIPDDEVEAALSEEPVYVYVQSSMVLGVLYDPKNYVLYIDWVPKKGAKSSHGKYQQVSHQEMRDFFRASSKGGYVWDHFIGRGHRRGGPSKKPYTPL